MLQNIRDRAHGIMAWVILIAIAVPFALWGIQNYLDVGKEKPVASVGERELFERDVNRVAEQDIAGLVGLEEQDEKAIRHQALQRLIHETLLHDEVVRLRLGLGDDDLRQVIQSLPYFQTDGKFDKEKYKLSMSSRGSSASGFATQIREALAMDQLQHAIARTAFVTSREADQYLRLKNQKRTVEYVLVPVAQEGAAPTPQEVEAYYHAHEAQFQTPERVAVQYVELGLDQVAQQVQVSEDELGAHYQEQKASFSSPERRKASHILIAAEPDANDEVYAAALAKAQQARERVGKGEDFAVVAKELSDDKLSVGKGGDLGVIAHGQMDKNFENAVFQLRADQVSEPVKTAFGYHVIKLTELTPAETKSYDEVKAEVRQTYQRNAAEKRFYELGEKLSQVSFEHSDSLEPTAEVVGVKLQETELFARDAGTGIAANSALRDAAFSQDVLDGHNSEAVELDAGHVVVLRVREHIRAAPRPLEEVRGQIVVQLRHEAAKAAALAEAKALFERFQQGASLANAAKVDNLSVQKPKPFGRDDGQMPPELLVAVFRMARPAADQTGQQLTSMTNGDQLILHLLKVEDGDAAAVDAKEKSSVRERLGRSKGQTEFADFVAQLKADGDVQVQEVKDKE